MKRLLLAVAVLAMVVRGPAAFACSCVSSPVREYFKSATVVFVGTATTVRSAEGRFIAAEFAISDLYKGSTGENVTLYTPSSEAECGIAFLPGQRYTVFARAATVQGPQASLCGGTSQDTKLLSSAGYVHPLERFGQTAARPPDGGGASSRILVIVLAIALAGGAATTLAVGHRKRALAKA